MAAEIRKICPVASPYETRISVCIAGGASAEVGQPDAARPAAAAAPGGGQPLPDDVADAAAEHGAEHRDADRAAEGAEEGDRRAGRTRGPSAATVFCTASTRFCIIMPTPRPSTNM